jgi:hypothetical protein
MDRLGLLNKVLSGVTNIDLGRKGLASDGNEHNGRLSYEKGISTALGAFQEAKTSRDPEILLLVEYTFLEQELQFCDTGDPDTHSSLTKAIQSFDDALRAYEVVQDSAYKAAEKTYPQTTKYRVASMPKDSFHIACIAHRTRLRNFLRTPGINMLEKSLLRQRFENMTIAENSYLEMQLVQIMN